MRLNAFFPRGRIVLGVAALLLLHLPAWADTPHERASLKGLKGVMVMVGMLGPPYGDHGLSIIQQLQTDIELRLRQGGIQVSSEPRGYLPGYLNVNITRWKNAGGTYEVNVLLRLNQLVRLERNLNIQTLGTTWHAESLFPVRADSLRDVQSHVADLVDEFINAYLEQNPKQ